MSPIEPTQKEAIVFIDGQNLYGAAKDAFGYNHPNYDVKRLSEWACTNRGWNLKKIYFYTGVPSPQANSFWHGFWSRKFSHMGRLGIELFSRELRYHNESFQCPSCKRTHTSLVGHEKGVDVRIALDVIRLAHEKAYDVAIIFSQDQDLREVADEIKRISIEQNRWIRLASAYPVSPTYENGRGIMDTEWIKINRQTYDACVDPTDYRIQPTDT